jgi:hypothetical protein
MNNEINTNYCVSNTPNRIMNYKDAQKEINQLVKVDNGTVPLSVTSFQLLRLLAAMILKKYDGFNIVNRELAILFNTLHPNEDERDHLFIGTRLNIIEKEGLIFMLNEIRPKEYQTKTVLFSKKFKDLVGISEENRGEIIHKKPKILQCLYSPSIRAFTLATVRYLKELKNITESISHVK